jgi:hypothetical protein
VGGGALLGDMQPPALETCGDVDCLSTYITDFYIERVAFYHGMLTLCWKCYGAYVNILGRVAIMDSNKTGPRTCVYPIRCALAPALSSPGNECSRPSRPAGAHKTPISCANMSSKCIK